MWYPLGLSEQSLWPSRIIAPALLGALGWPLIFLPHWRPSEDLLSRKVVRILAWKIQRKFIASLSLQLLVWLHSWMFFLVTGAGVKICCFDHGKIKPPYRESILSQTQVVQVDSPWWISEARCESRRFGGEDPTAATTSETNNQKKSSHKQTLRNFNSFKLMTSFCWQFIYLSMSIHWWCMSAFVCFQGSKKK